MKTYLVCLSDTGKEIPDFTEEALKAIPSLKRELMDGGKLDTPARERLETSVPVLAERLFTRLGFQVEGRVPGSAVTQRESTMLIPYDKMMSLPFHPGWEDGREGFRWCRFDAVVDRNRNLRAEITWNDNEDMVYTNVKYDSPQLLLETNERVGDELRTVDWAVLDVDQATAERLLLTDPAELAVLYKDEYNSLIQV